MEVFKEKAYIIEINTDGFSSFMLLIIAIVAQDKFLNNGNHNAQKLVKYYISNPKIREEPHQFYIQANSLTISKIFPQKEIAQFFIFLGEYCEEKE